MIFELLTPFVSSFALVFWSLQLHDFFSFFFSLDHLALQNVNKDNVIFLYFPNSVAKSDQKPKTKNEMNETIVSQISNSEFSRIQLTYHAIPWQVVKKMTIFPIRYVLKKSIHRQAGRWFKKAPPNTLSNLVIRNVLTRNKLVLRNHFQ